MPADAASMDRNWSPIRLVDFIRSPLQSLNFAVTEIACWPRRVGAIVGRHARRAACRRLTVDARLEVATTLEWGCVLRNGSELARPLNLHRARWHEARPDKCIEEWLWKVGYRDDRHEGLRGR